MIQFDSLSGAQQEALNAEFNIWRNSSEFAEWWYESGTYYEPDQRDNEEMFEAWLGRTHNVIY